MNIYRRIVPAVLLLGPVLTLTVPVQAQNSVTASARPAISVLDSTKEQDGLIGSVRRVRTETARIELKDGRPVEGPAQLVEITTYGIKGNRVENTSYPIAGSLVGKEEYKYDERGNITEMTLRDEGGAIVSRETYTYEFDKFGNWTKMVTSLVVFENGELKREPVEVTYRTLTYYFDDNIAKVVDETKSTPTVISTPTLTTPTVSAVPKAVLRDVEETRILLIDYAENARSAPEIGENPPPPFVLAKPEPPPPAVNPAMDLYATGRNRFDAGDFKGAVEAYREAVKLEPGSAEVFLNLAHAYLKLEKDADAIKAFRQSLKLNPDQPETLYGLGLAAFRARRFGEAADAFKKATILSPKMAKSHYGLSLAYQELGDTNGVLDQYRILETLDKKLARKLAETFPQYNFACRGVLRGCQ
ncbi:MAG TPA: tetratricopeptide repeat protein [Pyrinomonadaceae bacterium]|nr:tetratricopeptide repeat protein [Pyrinomonadaceae bacterium]